MPKIIKCCRIEGCSKQAKCKGLCDKHYTALRRHGNPLINLSNRDLPIEDRFWQKVNKGENDGCWHWTGAKGDYGHGIFVPDRNKPHMQAHAWAWMQVNGPVPDGLELDHLCRTRGCVNPDHLDPVTHRENVLRGASPAASHAVKTHCPQGHEYNKRNTYHTERGHRKCRTCGREYQARRKQRRVGQEA